MSKPTISPLTPMEVKQSRESHGTNQITPRKKQGFWRKFWGNLGDPVIRILLIALILQLVFSFHGGTDWFETLGIALAVFLATLISTLSEHGSEAAFSRLRESCDAQNCRVCRMDEQNHPVIQEIPVGDVVVGDVVCLEAGESISADGVLLSGDLTVDQSPMTGESREVEKHPYKGDIPQDLHPDMSESLFRGCVILSGKGEMLVSAVGDQTLLGDISQGIQNETRESPLKIRLTKLAGQISQLGYISAILVAIIYLINAFLFENAFDTDLILSQLHDIGYVFNTLISALTLGLTVLVVAVPEGLPMMIAVVLSANIKRMVKDHVLVRKPVGIEAAGSMNILFCDKTGTLTEGRLSVGQVILGDGEVIEGVTTLQKSAPAVFEGFIRTAYLNTSAQVGLRQGGGQRGVDAMGGNATDRALLSYILAAKQRSHPPMGEVVRYMPFDSQAKFSCAWVVESGRETFYIKGAPEKLLPMVTHICTKDGRMDIAKHQKIKADIDALTKGGERVILLAQGREGHIPTQQDMMQGKASHLVLICMVVLKDKLRPEAHKSVATLQRAGIHVVMMTGDHQATATAIAKASGILPSRAGEGVPYVVDSATLSRMSDQEIKEILPHLCVVARALPTDKSRLVALAQELDLVVGMTGDGINDAPALKSADVGFAMGEGTQVAKEAGDIIIMDNNLASIAKAVLYGRTIFKSIRKFITLQLTMNLCAMGVSMICPFLGVDAPVTVVQMLWINLIMDTLGGLAFAGEPPLSSYMEEPPKRRDEPILNAYMIHQIVYLGGFTIALCLFFLKSPWTTRLYRTAQDDIYLLTAFFALFIFSSVFNCFNTRTDRLKLLANLSKNKAFCLIMTGVLCIQVAFVYVGGEVLRTAPLTGKELCMTCALAALVFPAELVRKIFWRLKGKEEGF